MSSQNADSTGHLHNNDWIYDTNVKDDQTGNKGGRQWKDLFLDRAAQHRPLSDGIQLEISEAYRPNADRRRKEVFDTEAIL